MAMQRAIEPAESASTRTAQNDQPTEFPVREYIGAMALELAQMARFDGDEALARLLDAAAALAAEPLKRTPANGPA